MGYWKNVYICITDARECILKLDKNDSKYKEKEDEILVECSKNAGLDKNSFYELYVNTI